VTGFLDRSQNRVSLRLLSQLQNRPEDYCWAQFFGTTNAFAFTNRGLPYSGIKPGGLIMRRFPLVLVWIWMNIPPFTINNQIGPEAIRGDRANKPWRTLPFGRMTSQQAEKLVMALYPVAVALSTLTGGIWQSLSLVVLGVWYNNFGGDDKSCVTAVCASPRVLWKSLWVCPCQSIQSWCDSSLFWQQSSLLLLSGLGKGRKDLAKCQKRCDKDAIFYI